LIQSRSKITDLQDDLEEKTSLYLNAIKARDSYLEKLQKAKENIGHVEDLVQHRVQLAMKVERRELTRLTREVEAKEGELKIVKESNQYL
jgi:hypothetical protein